MRFSFPTATFCLALALVPVDLYAQQAVARSRPAARPRTPATVPTAAPTAPPAQTPPPLAAPAEGAVPGDSTPPTDDGPGGGQESETDIDATQSASFNSKDRIAIFSGNVRVKDPRFELACDELTVYLNKGAAATATPDPNAPAAPAKPAVPPAAPADPSAQASPAPGGGGIDHAVAKGHVIIIQRKAATKPGEEEKVSIGRGGLGTFDNKTGDMVLKDWPNLEQNGSSLVSTAQATVMTIHRDSSMNCDGPSKTKLLQKHGSGGSGGAAIFDFPTGPTNPNKGRAGTPAPAPAATPSRGTAPGTSH